MHGNCRVMLAERGASRGDLVLGDRQLVTQAQCLVLGRAHATQREVHPPQRLRPLDKGKALADRHLERQTVELVEHPREGLVAIIIDRNHRDEPPRFVPGWRQFDRILPEAHSPPGQVHAGIAVRQADRAHRAVVEAREELERLGAEAIGRVVDAEHPRRVLAERGDQRLAGGVE